MHLPRSLSLADRTPEEKKQTDLDKSEADKENKDMIDKARREAKEKDDKKRGIEAEGSAKKSGTK